MSSIDRIKLFGLEYEVGPVNLGQDTFLNLLIKAYEEKVKYVMARGRATDQDFDNFFLFPSNAIYGIGGNEIGWEFTCITSNKYFGVRLVLSGEAYSYSTLKLLETEWAARLGDDNGWHTYDSINEGFNTLHGFVGSSIGAHNEDVGAHPAIQAKIGTDIAAHNVNGSAHADIRDDVNTRQLKSEKNQINGYAGLDANTKVPLALLYDSVLGQVEYAGEFNASLGAFPTTTNALAPNDRPIRKGDYFITNVAGVVSGVDFNIGDWLIRHANAWGKVDNTDAVSSVNGKLGVVILDGTDIKVGAGDTATMQARIFAVVADIANRYTKAETYSATQIEQRLMDLLAMANLQDTLIGLYTNGQTLLASDLSPYNFVIVLGKDVNNTYTGTFKPSEIVSGNVISLSPTVYLTRGATSFTITAPTSVKLWGIKLDGITASEISYDGKTVEDALNEIFVPAYVTANHTKLESGITATNTFEINDETGDIKKITGTGIPNEITNSDFNNTNGWTAYRSTITAINNTLKITGTVAEITASAYWALPFTVGDVVYYNATLWTTDTTTSIGVSINGYRKQTNANAAALNTKYNLSGIWTLAGVVPNRFELFLTNTITGSINGLTLYCEKPYYYNVTALRAQGIKDDNGVPFTDLTDEQVKQQLDVWVNNGFISVIDKLVSKSDNLFNAEFNTLSNLDSEDLMTNGEFLFDVNSDAVPEGFGYSGAITEKSLNNGIIKFTPNGQYTSFARPNNSGAIVGNTYYTFAIIKSDNNKTSLTTYSPTVNAVHSGSGIFEYISSIATKTTTDNRIDIVTSLSADWTPIEVQRLGQFNITDLVARGILPSGLTNAEYKEMIDKAMFTNVPLRESAFIPVEPGIAYKLIKVGANTVNHKVLEYAADNQLVKINAITYTAGKSQVLTMNSLTSKIKIVSDLMKRPTQLLTNPNFDNGTTGWIIEQSSIAVNGGILTVTPLGAVDYAGFYQSIQWTAGEEFYNKVRVRATTPNIARIGFSIWTDANREYIPPVLNPVQNQWYIVSGIYTPNVKATSLKINSARKTTITNEQFVNERIEFDYRMAYNITTFKRAGVVNDTGTPFSKLSTLEIKDQMDIWTEVGFPDHVIAALYPNGVDSAIALKYNGADDVFRPQQIDELPLNLTLRSGEYWQDGYIVKQNGNAEYYPLKTKFSAWNYGQLKAVYKSGFPMDFQIQYAQNTAAQIKTTQEYLVEAREQLDYVTKGYNKLIEKLGDDVLSDDFDSFAGITSPAYEYYGLQGIKEGNELAIEGYGQSIQNLLSKATTIQTTQTVRGVTVTYDPATGIFTANGTSTAGAAFNITLASGMDFGLPTGTAVQLMRYYDSGTVNLNGSYIGYTITGVSTSNRINENSESLYDPYINGSGNLSANHATDRQQVFFQVWAPGIVFTDFKFKIGIYEGLQLRPFILPTETPAKSNVTVYNRTLNNLNIINTTIPVTAGVTITYDPYTQEFLLSGTATGTASVSLNATFAVKSGDRLSIKRLYQSGDVTGVGGVLPRLKLDNSSNVTIVYNDIYKMTAPEGQTPTPDISFNTGTAPADATLTLKLGITSGQVFDNYRFRLMVHNKSSDIGYVEYRKETIGTMLVGANEKTTIKFKAIPFGMLELIAANDSLNLLFGDSITDLRYSVLEYNAGIGSPNRKISALDERIASIDTIFKDKVIAVWGDSRESNNPTSDPNGVGDQKDTSWPALLAKKLKARVLNFGLSGGAWAQNTTQQDAAAAIVNRVQTEDPTASADIIIISSMNDFKLATPLGLPTSTTITDYYGALRLTFQRLATKYPGKKIIVVLPQKRFDENVRYGSGASYYAYRKAQMDVCKEYGISTVDLYNNLPNSKLGSAPTAYATYMLNDTHFSAIGNDFVAELVARHLIGNGNSGSVDSLPPIPSTDGTYTLKVVITGGIPVFSWVA